MCNESEKPKDLSDLEIIDLWKNTQYDYLAGELSWMKRVILTVRDAIEEDRKRRTQ